MLTEPVSEALPLSVVVAPEFITKFPTAVFALANERAPEAPLPTVIVIARIESFAVIVAPLAILIAESMPEEAPIPYCKELLALKFIVP